MTNKDILNGSQLIVSFTPKGGSETVTAFSTSHSFNISTSQEDVLTKEYGKYPGKIIGTVEWEVTCENLAGDGAGVSSIEALLGAFKAQAASGDPVSISFGNIGAQWNNGKGTMGQDGTLGAFTGVTTPIISGQAIITALSMNAAAGENATISATFTGVGALNGWGDETPSGPQGPQGN